MTQKAIIKGDGVLRDIITKYNGEIDEPEGRITIQISLTLLREINSIIEKQETETTIKTKEKSND